VKSLLVAAFAAATVGLLSCACSGPGSGAAPRATVTTRPAVAASQQPSPPAGSAPGSPAGSPAAGSRVASQASPQASSQSDVPGCLSRYLGTKIVPSGDSLNSVYVNIDFTNLGNVPCTLYGYPGVSLGGGVPVTQIGLPSTENLATPRQLVTLRPGGIAYAQLQIVQAATYRPSACQPMPADYLDIIPPNQTAAIPTYYTTTACARPVHLLTADAVQPGTRH
jgi:hypothetical protein